MDAISVDDSGEGKIKLAYIDSGPPTTAIDPGNYTTIVCVHGHTYHAHNFARLFSVASTRGVRVIALNRRDYKGSTPYSKDELTALSGSSAEGEEVSENSDNTENSQEAFLKDRGLEIAHFLVRLIKEKAVPKIDEHGGGIVLLGWSLGAITTLAFLANVRSFAMDIQGTLNSYLRALLIYDLPNNSTGILPPATGGYHPLSDTTLPVRVRGITFGTWVSSYYSHPAYSRSRSGSPADPTPGTSIDDETNSSKKMAQVRNIPGAKRTISDLEVRAPAYPFRKCTLDTLAPRDLLSCIDITPGARSESLLWALPRSLLLRQTERALVLGTAETWRKEQVNADLGAAGDNLLLSGLKVRILYGLSSLWPVQWETWGLEDLTQGWRKEGKLMRPIEFIPVSKANHFLHWDDPEQFLNVCLDAISM